MALRERLLAHLRALPAGELSTRSRIAAELGLSPRERRGLAPLLVQLVSEGRLRSNRGRYAAVAEPAEVCGTFHAARGAYGFVTPDGAPDGSRDVFIPPPATAGALEGDRVRVRVAPRLPGDKGPEGEVTALLARSRRPVAGLVRGGFLYPFGAVPNPIALPRGSAGEGGVALVTLCPGEGPPLAESVEVVGAFEDPRTPVRVAEARYGLTHEFPPAVAREADALPEEPPAGDLEGRADLRFLPAVTVDPEDAKDFDDALSLRREGAGWRLWVHIADVSHYVRPGSAMDAEALRRGNTTYLPGVAYHMLPSRLSGGLCSLVEGRDRLTFTAELAVAPDGRVAEARFRKAVIRSRRRLTYGEAQAALDGEGSLEPDLAALVGELGALSEVLSARRAARGSLDLDLPEADLRFGLTGRVEEVLPAARLASHRLVEECMLLANTAVAEALERAGAPCLYRVHEAPDPRKLEALRPLLNALGLGEASRGDLADPAILRAVLERARGHRAEKLVSYLVLRGMMQARYAVANAGHFGLALATYAHFTSPIRRYPDLLVHRALAAALGLGPAPEGDLAFAAAHCSNAERAADAAEREVMVWHQMAFLSGRLGDTFDALVLGFSRAGIRVELLDHLIEGLCPFRLVEDDRLRVDPDGLRARGVYSGAVLRVGDPLAVRLVRVDATALEAQFVPEGWPGPVRGRGGRRGR